MKKAIKEALIVICIIPLFSLVFGCASQPNSARPQWIESPARNQAVGSCGFHALGKDKQHDCAMGRARLELAARKGVQLKSILLMTESATNRSSDSRMDGQLIQQVDTQIKTRLVDSYHDKQRDIYWVLVEEN